MNSHELIIMRHAKSDWSSDTATDFERSLSKRGIRDATRMSAWLKEQQIIPDRIVSSPATRTKMTVHIVCDGLDINTSEITWDYRIYETGIEELLEVISEYGPHANRLLLIGHNPGLDALLDFLSREKPRRNENDKLMTTAAIAILNYDNHPISTWRHSARLTHLVRPKGLSG